MALYQQRPTPEEGAFFRAAWMKTYVAANRPKAEEMRIYAASDHAIGTDRKKHDASCMVIAGVCPNKYLWMLDCYWERQPPDQTVEAMLDMCALWKPSFWFAENEAILKSIGPWIHKRKIERGIPVVIDPIPVHKNKEAIAQSIAGLMQAGRVVFPRAAPWFPEAKHELMHFPHGTNDDFVTAISIMGLKVLAAYRRHPAARREVAAIRHVRLVEKGNGISGQVARWAAGGVVMIIKGYDIDVPEARAALVLELQEDVRADKKHFADAFKQMLDDMEVCWTGAQTRWPKNNYKVNITQRFVRQKVASLYAKNPRAVAKCRPKMKYKFWDGTMQQLQAAAEGMPDPMTAMMIMQDVQQGKAEDEMYEKLGKTLESCFHYYINEQIPTFKSQMKRCVRSAIQTAVGYVKLGFQRETDLSPDNKAKIADSQQRFAHIQRLVAELGPEGDKTLLDAEAEELRLAIAGVAGARDRHYPRRAGVRFPETDERDPGQEVHFARWVDRRRLAHGRTFHDAGRGERVLPARYLRADCGECLRPGYTAYSTTGVEYRQNPRNDLTGKRDDLVCVWMMYHKPTGLKFELADGYKDFLKEPGSARGPGRALLPDLRAVLQRAGAPDQTLPAERREQHDAAADGAEPAEGSATRTP